MPPKTVKCVICGSEVTKRQSLSLKQLTGADGRACRYHEEVIEAVSNMQKEKSLQVKLRQAEKTMRKIVAVEQVRIWYAFYGFSDTMVFARLRKVMSHKEAIEIMNEVEKIGKILTEDEILQIAAMNVVLHEKGMANSI